MKVLKKIRTHRRWTAVCGLVGFCAALLVLPATQALAASSLPYVDGNAIGSIGLCDQDGNAITSGNINTKPFIWKAVDQTAAAAPYNVSGASATLYAFQPRQEIEPSEWNGQQLSGTSRFTTPAHPAAAMTGRDASLSAYMTAYPTKWDGLIELRIFLSAPNHPVDNSTYDALNIKVTGDTWSVVDGTPVSCSAGNSTSIEMALATNSAQLASLSAQTTEVGRDNSGSVPSASAVAGSTPSASAVAAAPPAATDAAQLGNSSSGSGSSSSLVIWVVVAVVVLGGGFGALRLIRSRS